MKSLRSFIDEGAEEKYQDNLRVLIVSSAYKYTRSSDAAQKRLSKSGEPPIFRTARRFKEESENLNHEVYIFAS